MRIIIDIDQQEENSDNVKVNIKAEGAKGKESQAVYWLLTPKAISILTKIPEDIVNKIKE